MGSTSATGVNHRIRRLRVGDDLRTRDRACVVSTIADDDEHLALEAAFPDIVEAGVHGVVDGGLPSRFDRLNERDPQNRFLMRERRIRRQWK